MIKIFLRKIDRHEAYSPEAVVRVISHWKNSMIRPQDVMPEPQELGELEKVYRLYEEWKEENYYDFDDLINETYQCIRISFLLQDL
ncbi:UvrD-helicase domain-containing protein [Peribacillus loiseleuriae]|nr:UvrD-helicase domain-containing protein [Peribacillus loiseleuriae]